MVDTIIHHISMNNHIDTHCHVLYSIDDGAKTINDSLEMLKSFEKLGFSKVILTPHYKNAYHANNVIKRSLYNNLRVEASRNNINIDLYLANEVRLSSDIISLIKNDEITLLGNYLFLELPFTNTIIHLDNIIYELQNLGINIILVHPERYYYLKEDDYKNLIDKDVLFQVNYESILGTYGRDAKKRCKYLLKNKMVFLLGSDSHKPTANFFVKFNKIERKLKRITLEDYYNDLVYNNMYRILESIK